MGKFSRFPKLKIYVKLTGCEMGNEFCRMVWKELSIHKTCLAHVYSCFCMFVAGPWPAAICGPWAPLPGPPGCNQSDKIPTGNTNTRTERICAASVFICAYMLDIQPRFCTCRDSNP